MSQAALSPTQVPAPGEDESFYEVVDGQRVEQPPMGAFETVFTTKLALCIGAFLRSNPFGQLTVETLFLIDSLRDLQRRPDLAYVSYDRWARGRRVPSSNVWSVVPDLAIEVISPSSTATEVLTKVQGYFRSGVRLVWVVYPAQEQFYMYESPTAVRVFEHDNTLHGGAVLPGFRLPLAELFEPEIETDENGTQSPTASSE